MKSIKTLNKFDVVYFFLALLFALILLPSNLKSIGILLFGMNSFNSKFLNHYPWENEDNLLDTIIQLQKLNKSYSVLAAKESVIFNSY